MVVSKLNITTYMYVSNGRDGCLMATCGFSSGFIKRMTYINNTLSREVIRRENRKRTNVTKKDLIPSPSKGIVRVERPKKEKIN